jgi:hypothetical protein
MASKATEKNAQGPRSSIRRQRTIRGPHARLSAENRRRRMLGMVADSNTDYEFLESQQRSPPHEAEASSIASLQARAHRLFDDERMRLRDTMSFERQHLHPPHTDIDGPLMPPVPESRDYSGIDERERRREIQRLHEVRRDLRRIARRRPAPTPPYTETDLALMARLGTDSPRPSSLTPAVSPPRESFGDVRMNFPSFGLRANPSDSSDQLDFRAREPPYTSDVSDQIISTTRVLLSNDSDVAGLMYVTALHRY